MKCASAACAGVGIRPPGSSALEAALPLQGLPGEETGGHPPQAGRLLCVQHERGD